VHTRHSTVAKWAYSTFGIQATALLKLTNCLTTRSRVIFEKQIATRLVEKFSTFRRTRRIITVFTRACHSTYPEPDESNSPPIFMSILILISHYSNKKYQNTESDPLSLLHIPLAAVLGDAHSLPETSI
jgi:hypothetical protein